MFQTCMMVFLRAKKRCKFAFFWGQRSADGLHILFKVIVAAKLDHTCTFGIVEILGPEIFDGIPAEADHCFFFFGSNR
jgi:hypothetical protein